MTSNITGVADPRRPEGGVSLSVELSGTCTPDRVTVALSVPSQPDAETG